MLNLKTEPEQRPTGNIAKELKNLTYWVKKIKEGKQGKEKRREKEGVEKR